MSKDTIYREDAIKAINARSNWYQVTCNGKQIAVMLMAKDVNEILEKVPSADRPQGEWIITEQDNGHKWTHRKCSECGKGIIEPLGVSGMNFCPNCGARMKGASK
jgi:ribosomal protein S27AE